MLAILISLAAGALAAGATSFATHHPAWLTFAGVAGFLASSFVINRIFGKRLKAIFDRVQKALEGAQLEANKIVNRVQQRGGGMSANLLQDKVEKVMEDAFGNALKVLDEATPLFKWTLLTERQVATYRVQILYQLKRFDEVDKLLPRVLLWEPLTLAMKMAREFEHDSPNLEKTYKKGIRRFKGDKAVLIYSAYAWMLVKRREFDKARELLAKAKEKTQSPDLDRNWQALSNNKPQHFSNQFLGEQWYALHLEKLKPAKQKVSKGELKNNPMYGGKRRF